MYTKELIKTNYNQQMFDLHTCYIATAEQSGVMSGKG